MGRADADTFETLREDVLTRLVDIRGSIDAAYARVPDDEMRDQFGVVLRNMAGYLATGDEEALRGFIARWAAMREGQGFGPENVLHAVVAIADVVVRVAQKRYGPGEQTELLRAVTAMAGLVARWLIAGLADELAQRSRQLRALEQELGR